ncbi:hypothetical protein [Alkaliflexus imshenetskii]|uniref:hypothetical protein n=1 Tax=Alkaliflexus imshenetskii TaxID=286730 RepID=UPI0004B40726|nr:hypothetical protein [Alkaliflexus imshenetskii]
MAGDIDMQSMNGTELLFSLLQFLRIIAHLVRIPDMEENQGGFFNKECGLV